MATNPDPLTDDQDRRQHASTLLPSQRVAVPPAPGTAEADFLQNLNAVYGRGDDAEDQLLPAAMRSHMRRVLDQES